LPKAKILYPVVLAAAAMLLAACSPSPSLDASSTPIRSCSQLVTAAIQAVSACHRIGRNQVCYNSDNTADLAAIAEVKTASGGETAPAWSAALIKAQANLPDSRPDAAITFILYGGAVLDQVSPDMAAARLHTPSNSPPCPAAPPAGLLIQTPLDESVTFSLNGASVTLGSTLYVSTADQMLTIMMLEGTAVVSALNITRIVRAGAQVTLLLDETLRVSSAPSELEPLEADAIQHLPLMLLERPITLPAPLQLSTPTAQPALATATAAPVEASCIPRPDWSGTYAIQRGDTLTAVAQQFGLAPAELQQGNCLSNPNRIFPGQVLRIPGTPLTPSPAGGE